jgi:hypothetical protein
MEIMVERGVHMRMKKVERIQTPFQFLVRAIRRTAVTWRGGLLLKRHGDPALRFLDTALPENEAPSRNIIIFRRLSHKDFHHR